MLVFINVLVISGNKPWEVLSLRTLKSREKKSDERKPELWALLLSSNRERTWAGKSCVCSVRMCSAVGHRLDRLKQPSIISHLTSPERAAGFVRKLREAKVLDQYHCNAPDLRS